MLSQSWGVHEVLIAWMRKDTYTYLTPTAANLDNVAKGVVYTGAVADDSTGCQYWTHYSFEKRSLVWAFTHGMSVPGLVIHHILGWLGGLTPEQLIDIDRYEVKCQ